MTKMKERSSIHERSVLLIDGAREHFDQRLTQYREIMLLGLRDSLNHIHIVSVAVRGGIFSPSIHSPSIPFSLQLRSESSRYTLSQQKQTTMSSLTDIVPAGVVTGDDLLTLLEHARTNGYAIPAVNCTR